LGHDPARTSIGGRFLGVTLTFLAVLVGWVFFRASTVSGALSILRSMAGLNGITLPDAIALRIGPVAGWLGDFGIVFTPGGGHDFIMNFVWLTVLLPIVFLAPNIQQIMQRFRPFLDYRHAADSSRLAWSAEWRWALAMAFVLASGLLSLTRPSEFLYFQF
jgi:hypothetical protein